MLVGLAAALSLASSLTIEVPYLPQTDALCGGAAAAMVFRYWGDAHADPQQFASLVERRRGVSGIANDVLVRAIRSRGWRAELLADSNGAANGLDALRARVAARQPVIVLLADRGDQYHYVVVSGFTDRAVVVHDPSWGPSRAIKIEKFGALWSASGSWAIVVLPGDRQAATPRQPSPDSAEPAEPASADPCAASVERAVIEVHSRGLSHADEVLEPLRARCADSPALQRELAGVRFMQKRWRDSETLARNVLARAPADAYASSVLGASLFMQDEPVSALRAWNAIDQPRLDLVRISGLTRSRYQAVVDAIGLRAGALLTPDDFVRAQHRLEDLPDRVGSRLSLRPGEDGFATVDVAIAERSGLPRGYAEWAAIGATAAIEREAAVTLPGFTGQGEIWTASWRWWTNRPRVALGFAAPRVAALPGVWRVDGSWEAETYAVASASRRESRTHGGLTVSDWIRPHLRYAVSGGLDAWSGGRRAVMAGGSLERRLFGDRLAIIGDAATWAAIGSSEIDRSFNAVGIRTRLRTPSAPRTWSYDIGVGATRVSDDAPMSIWHGAGEGRARPNLLRAHPLLDGGVIEADGESAFGRTLRYASIEGQRWLPRPSIVRAAVAAFVDVARASRRAVAEDSPTQVDIGGGVRIRMPGAQGILRVDVAHGLRDGSDALTVGWMVR